MQGTLQVSPVVLVSVFLATEFCKGSF
jgi:hypothetical protein